MDVLDPANTLLARAKPRFVSERTRRTSGNSAATMSALPSDDPLSSTAACTRTSRVPGACLNNVVRHSRSNSRVLYEAMIASTCTGLPDMWFPRLVNSATLEVVCGYHRSGCGVTRVCRAPGGNGGSGIWTPRCATGLSLRRFRPAARRSAKSGPGLPASRRGPPARSSGWDPGPDDRHGDVVALPNLERVQGNGARVPLGDRSVAATVAVDTFEHIPAGERSAVVEEMLRVTAPGGRLVIIGPTGSAAADGDRWLLRTLRRNGPEPSGRGGFTSTWKTGFRPLRRCARCSNLPGSSACAAPGT